MGLFVHPELCISVRTSKYSLVTTKLTDTVQRKWLKGVPASQERKSALQAPAIRQRVNCGSRAGTDQHSRTALW